MAFTYYLFAQGFSLIIFLKVAENYKDNMEVKALDLHIPNTSSPSTIDESPKHPSEMIPKY